MENAHTHRLRKTRTHTHMLTVFGLPSTDWLAVQAGSDGFAWPGGLGRLLEDQAGALISLA